MHDVTVPTTATRAAIYLRISLDHTGEGLAVERQREDCEKIATARGWNVSQVYQDSVSASKRTVNRPGYNSMVSDYEDGKFEAIICYDLDRLTRQPRQLEDWIDQAEHKGLKLVTANGEADLTTDGGRMYARIKAAVARSEVERKGARQARALQQRSELGKPPLGVRLTGYQPDGAVIVDEATSVREIFRLFTAGESLKAISRELNERGLTSRRGPFTPSTVRTILTNPRYAGRAVYRGKETGQLGNWEALVSAEVFDLTQVKLSDPSRIKNREGTERKHLGSGLYYCDICAGRIRANGKRYWCKEGGHVTRTAAAIDEFVLRFVAWRVSQPDVMEFLAPSHDAELAELREQEQNLRDRLVKVDSDYDAGLIDGLRFKSATDRVKDGLAGVAEARARLTGNSVLGEIVTASDPAVTFLSAPLGVRRTVIDTLCVVTLKRQPQGRKGFDPRSVAIIMKKRGLTSVEVPVPWDDKWAVEVGYTPNLPEGTEVALRRALGTVDTA